MITWDVICDALLMTVLRPLAVALVVAGLFYALKLRAIGAVLAVILAFLAGNHDRDAVEFRLDSDEPLTVSQLWASARASVSRDPGEVYAPPPRYWLPWVALLAGVAGLATCSARVPRVVKVVIMLATVMVSARLLMSAQNVANTPWHWPIIAATMLLLWWRLLNAWHTRPGWRALMPCVAGFFTASGVLVFAESARLADIATIVGTAMLGVGAVAVISKRPVPQLAPSAAVLLPGLLLIGERTSVSDLAWYWFAVPIIVAIGLTPLRLKTTAGQPISTAHPTNRGSQS